MPTELAEDGVTIRTALEGHGIILDFPSLYDEPEIEVWKPANTGEAKGVLSDKAWGKDKVFSDIIDHTAKEFSTSTQSQWAALK
eukprot:3075830-Pleurochrysis_carterae.AAC.1